MPEGSGTWARDTTALLWTELLSLQCSQLSAIKVGAFRMLVEIAAVVAKEAAPVALESLVRALLTAQDAQLERLEALHEDVKVLVEGPWKRAQIHLGEVGTVKGRHRQEECLREAQRALYEALSLSQGTAREAVIAADLALVWGLRGERDEASNWARQSFDAAERYLIMAADEPMNW